MREIESDKIEHFTIILAPDTKTGRHKMDQKLKLNRLA